MQQDVVNRLNKLSSPPRKVPLYIKSKMLTGVLGLVANTMILAGGIFVFVFILGSRLLPALKMGHLEGKIPGRITKIMRTGSSSNKRRIFRIHYEYEVDGRLYKQYSYNTGLRYKDKMLKTGKDVLIRYSLDNPKLSRISGMRYSTFGAFVLLTLIFPITGFVIFLISHLKGIRYINLLKCGKLADGKIIGKQKTRTKINNKYVFKFHFSYKDEYGAEYKNSIRSVPKHDIGDEAEEPVLYNPNKPSSAILIDALPESLGIDENGNWISMSKNGIFSLFVISHVFAWGMIGLLIGAIVYQLS